MEFNSLMIFDGVIPNPDKYVENILSKDFENFNDQVNTFKGIQLIEDEFVSSFLKYNLNDAEVVYNFARKSPENQEEPNFIHSDKNMCDYVAILYLNKEFPKEAGTTLYENVHSSSMIDREEDNKLFEKSISVYMKYNRMIVFPSDLYHSRNLKENFGSGDKSRLVQVIFLKRK